MFSASNHSQQDPRLQQEQQYQHPAQFDTYHAPPQHSPQLPPAHSQQGYDMTSYSTYPPEHQQQQHFINQQGAARGEPSPSLPSRTGRRELNTLPTRFFASCSPTDSTVGPSRNSISGPSHRRDYSSGGGGSGGAGASGSGAVGRTSAANAYATGGSGSAGRGAGTPYARPMEPVPLQANGLGGPATHTVKASSTTSEFTKRKNWSQHIIDEIQVSFCTVTLSCCTAS